MTTPSPSADIFTHSASYVNTSDVFHQGRHFSDAHKALTAIGMGSIILLAIFGNVFVVFAFVLFKNLRTVNNCFILSLAVSDLLVALVPLPMWMIYTLSDATWWSPPENTHSIYRVWLFLDVTCGISSIFLLTCISIERYICMVHTLFYQRNATRTRAFAIVAMVLAIVLTLASFRVAYLKTPPPTFEYIFSFGCFLLPLLIIIVMYAMLLCFTKKCAAAHETTTAVGSCRAGTTRFFREKKTAYLMIVIVVVFFVCWFPFFLLHFVVGCVECTRVLHKVTIVSAVKWFHYSNSCLNPIIYAGMSKDFRKHFKTILANICGCLSAGRGKPPQPNSTATVVFEDTNL